jgi:hypothetical protein
MAVALVGVFAAGASGHRFAFDTAVTIDFEKGNKKNDPLALDTFSGRVISPKANCSQDRRVVLKRRTADGTTAVGTDYTNDNGFYEVKLADARGTYFARATKKVLRKGTKHRHTCRRDSSPDDRVR